MASQNKASIYPSLPGDYGLKLLMRLIACPGTTGNEAPIAALLHEELLAIGVSPFSIFQDDSFLRIPVNTPCGNLIVQLNGNRIGPSLLFSTHMDTVPLCEGAVPFYDETSGRIVSAGKTALGGDNRTGCAALVLLAARLLRSQIQYPKITLLFTVREESGLFGARYVSTKQLGSPQYGFNVDGGSPARFIRGAVGAERWEATIEGFASHAGVHPEKGISATIVASLALADIYKNGWFGKVVKDNREGSSYVGILSGKNGESVGTATNVVTDFLQMRGESRSFDANLVKEITGAYLLALQTAANQVQSIPAKTANILFKAQADYDAFVLPEDSSVVIHAIEAAKTIGLSPSLELGKGGLDSNWIVKHGVPSLTFGAGQHEIHTLNEYVDLREFHEGCDLAFSLATYLPKT